MSTTNLPIKQDTASTTPHLAVAIPAWTVQYAVWVPVVLAARLVLWLVRTVLAIAKYSIGAVVLLFIPIVGWIILVIWIMGRHDERMIALLVEQAKPEQKRSVFKPWFT